MNNNRWANFSAGPARIPDSVIEQIKNEAFDYQSRGVAIFEISHRSQLFLSLLNDTIADLKMLLKIPNHFKIILLNIGASMHYSLLPLNFAFKKPAAYVDTGIFSARAINIGTNYCTLDVVASSKAANYSYIPIIKGDYRKYNYLHITSNNTIYGTQYKDLPIINTPLIVDATSDICSQLIDFENLAMIYASAQKNLGVAGLSLAIIDEQLLATTTPNLADDHLNYNSYVTSNSLQNTINTFAVYVMSLILKWIINQGGIVAINKQNQQQASTIYQVIDDSAGFYTGYANSEYRSLMNVSFTTKNAELDHIFIEQAELANLYYLKGHKALGGMRASIYNACRNSDITNLADFMTQFMHKFG